MAVAFWAGVMAAPACSVQSPPVKGQCELPVLEGSTCPGVRLLLQVRTCRDIQSPAQSPGAGHPQARLLLPLSWAGLDTGEVSK